MSDDAKKDEADTPESANPEAEAAKVADAAKGDDAKAEEPKAEEPKAEEAPAEEPKAEEAPAEEPKAEEPKAEEPKAEEAPAEEAPAEEAPAEEAPAEEAPAAEVAREGEVLGMLVEFETAESLMAGCAQVRDAGYSKWDAHTPYPVHGLDQAMGVKATILPWIVFCGGLTGAMAGLGLQLYTNGIELPFSVSGTLIDPFLPSGYPYVVSGKPVFSVQANIPVIFELTILLSAFGAFFGMWGLNLLPRFHHPVFFSERFKRATQDRFFISIEAGDPLFDRERTRRLATALGGSHVEELVQEQEG